MKMEFSALKRRLYLPFYLVFLLLIATSTAWAVQRIKMLEGTLEIRSATYLDEKQSHPTKDVIEYAFRADDGAVYSLQFVDKVPAYLKTGQRLKIRDGQLLSPNADGTPEIMLLSKNITLIKDIKVSAIPDAFGNQTTIVMLVNFQDNPNDKPWTAGQVNDVVFNTLNNMYHEFSYNQTNVVGNVAGWFTIALNRGASCDSIRNSLPFMANEAAQRAGVDLSKYNRRVYMFPRNVNCTWAGLGSVGGKPSIAWLNGVNRSDVTGHEVGHNLGLYHSHSLECDGSSNEGVCKSVEYGDFADTMGTPYAYPNSHFSAFQKERLGWLNYASSPPIQTVTESGTYTIDPYETANGKVKALKILKKSTSDLDKNYYYLEFRQGIGFDENLGKCTDCDFTQGVTVHEGNLAAPNSSYILDMSPNDGDKSKKMTLHQGQSFTDKNAENNGVTITVDSVSAAGAVVNVKFGNTPPPPCTHFNPTLSVIPTDTQYVRAGESAVYRFTLWNNDSVGCPASNYALTSYADHFILVSLEHQFISLKPNEHREFAVTAATTLATPIGDYGVGVNAVNLDAPDFHSYVIARLGVIK